MKLEVCEDVQTIYYPNNHEICEALTYLKEGSNAAFAILSTDDMTYLQVCGDRKQGFSVEYQEGELGRHFVSVDREGLEKVISAFVMYRDNNEKWKETFEWQELEL